jgi:NAD(P)H-flavin reductase
LRLACERKILIAGGVIAANLPQLAKNARRASRRMSVVM